MQNTEQSGVATLEKPAAAKAPQPQLVVQTPLQFDVIKKLILDFQASLDQEHDIGMMLTQFSSSMLMEIAEIGFDGSQLLIFRGTVNGQEATLIQHISQLNFLLLSIDKAPEIPKREIGFTADWTPPTQE